MDHWISCWNLSVVRGGNMQYLLFRLYGPMASWGEIAVGESRHTARYPGKSAIIGLLSAALGIKRNNEEEQLLMQEGYAIAVQVFSHGTLLRDYHTAQAPRSVRNTSYRSRREELVSGKAYLGTILSSREYRTDALALVSVRELPDAPHTLQTIKSHLKKPKFHLYLGRKSCPLAAPLYPQIIEAGDYHEAFKAYEHKPMMPTGMASDGAVSHRDRYWLQVPDERYYYWQGEPSDFSVTLDLIRVQTRTRHDQPLSRDRWQFSPRQEHYFYDAGGEVCISPESE
ncbi:CRISPR system CASCADE complex protein CasD [delta proteobacterium NaphS2]|nr:CRISPR system CASCADE complex protein CasD [delta proteobacterium NaphS2]